MEEEEVGGKAGVSTETHKKSKKRGSHKKLKRAGKKVRDGKNRSRDVPAREEVKKESTLERETLGLEENVEIAKALGRKGKKRLREDKKMAEEFKSSGGSSSRLRPRKQVPSFRKVNLGEGNYSKLVGKRIKVFWPDEKKWFVGRVTSFDNGKKVHEISYDDGDKETLELKTERFQLEVLPNEVFGGDLAEEASAGSKEHASIPMIENKEKGPPKSKKQKEVASTDVEINEAQKDGKEKSGTEEDAKPEKKREKTLKFIKRGSSKNQGSKDNANLEVSKLLSEEGSKDSSKKYDNLEEAAMDVDEPGGQCENSNDVKQADETNILMKNKSESHEISRDTKAKLELKDHNQEEKQAVSDNVTPEIKNDGPVKDEMEDKESGGEKTSKGDDDQAKKDESQIASPKIMDKKGHAKSKIKK